LAGIFALAVVQFAQVTRQASLTVRITDEKGRPTPVRVHLEDSAGNKPRVRGALAVSDSAIPIPRQAIAVMWGQQDRAEGYVDQPDGSFYVDGSFDVTLPAGSYRLTISKGFEYTPQTVAIDLAPSASVRRDLQLARWVDMPSRGWYAADDHIHLRRSPGDDAKIAKWIAAEDLEIGNLLQMGDFFSTYFSQYAFGDRGRYEENGRMLSSGQEDPRTPEIGHTISLGASEFVRMTRDYYSFDKVFDRVHQLGGISGFAHQAFSFHGYRGMALNTLRGKTDFLELVQFCVPEGPLPVQHYYEFLDLGFKLTALAGSDFPWCGNGFAQIGNARYYVYTGGPLTFESYMSGLKGGHTFVTTGPMLLLTVNGRMPGDTLDVQPGAKLHVTAEAIGPVKDVEIIGHGKVLARSAGPKAEVDLTAGHGIWIAARCGDGAKRVAHTTPVYVTVNGRGFQNPETARRNVEVVGGYLTELEGDLAGPSAQVDAQAWRHRAELERQIVEARAVLRGLRVD
jgi:hypothetical protein